MQSGDRVETEETEGNWTITWQRGRVRISRTLATRFIPTPLLTELKRLVRSEEQ